MTDHLQAILDDYKLDAQVQAANKRVLYCAGWKCGRASWFYSVADRWECLACGCSLYAKENVIEAERLLNEMTVHGTTIEIQEDLNETIVNGGSVKYQGKTVVHVVALDEGRLRLYFNADGSRSANVPQTTYLQVIQN